MKASIRMLALAVAIFLSGSVTAKECWTLSHISGYSGFSTEDYKFKADGFSRSILLCFDEKTGSVSGDDTQFVRFGSSTLAGYATNRGIELFEVYQIDRVKGRVLFTKSRIGSGSLIPGLPDVVEAFVGTAAKISE